jgi:hypothetical protein
MGKTTFSGPVASQGGFIENSFTTAERDAIVNPVVGLMIYNTTTDTYEVYGNSGWQEAFAPPVPPTTTYTRGVDYTNPGISWTSDNGTTGRLYISNAQWLNTGWQDIIATPSGTSFTFIDALFSVTITGTMTSVFGGGAGSYFADVSFSAPVMPTMSNQNVISLTI